MTKHKIFVPCFSLIVLFFAMTATAAEPPSGNINWGSDANISGWAQSISLNSVTFNGDQRTGNTMGGGDGGGTPPIAVGGQPFPNPVTPTVPTQGLPTNLGQLIQEIFTWSLGILGISVFVMFFYSGFLYLTAAGNTARTGEAKTHMTNAVFGAILLLSAYLILYTINPDFVKSTVNLPGLGPTSQNPTQNTTGGSLVACDSPPNAISPDPMSIMQQVKSEFPNIDLTNEGPGFGTRDEFTAIVAWRLHQIDANWGRKRAAGPQSTDTLGYLRTDIGPGRFEAVDLVSGTTGNLIRGCFGVVDSGQTWINPNPAP